MTTTTTTHTSFWNLAGPIRWSLVRFLFLLVSGGWRRVEAFSPCSSFYASHHATTVHPPPIFPSTMSPGWRKKDTKSTRIGPSSSWEQPRLQSIHSWTADEVAAEPCDRSCSVQTRSMITRREGLRAGMTAAVGWTLGIARASADFSAISNPSTPTIPMVTLEEFRILLRDAARSMEKVTLSGPRNEQVTVTLLDGTTFGISGLTESPTDPRSPLQVVALCRDARIPVEFTQYQAALQKIKDNNGGRLQKIVYTNARVREAQAKTEEQRQRMIQDEQDRLAALARLQESPETSAASASVVGP